MLYGVAVSLATRLMSHDCVHWCSLRHSLLWQPPSKVHTPFAWHVPTNGPLGSAMDIAVQLYLQTVPTAAGAVQLMARAQALDGMLVQ